MRYSKREENDIFLFYTQKYVRIPPDSVLIVSQPTNACVVSPVIMFLDNPRIKFPELTVGKVTAVVQHI